MADYKHILLTCDLAHDDSVVNNKAIALAQQFGAKLSIAHVVEPIPAYSFGYLGIADVAGQLLKNAGEEMEKLGSRLKIAKEDQHVKVGAVKTELLEIADKLAIDLIVIGSHGRHGLGRLLGSTANAVLHGALCDVLVVRAAAE